MPTPRKSRAELALSGTLQRNPRRYGDTIKPNPTVILPLGRPPGYFNRSQRLAWAEVARTAGPGQLTRSDRLAVEIAVHLITRMRQTIPKPSEFTVLIGILGRLGLTPADRQKMRLEPLSKPAVGDPAWDALDELD